MKKFAAKLLLIAMASVLFVSFSHAQNNPVITSIQGKLIRTTPALVNIDRTTMYGAPLKNTRYKEELLGVVDIERAEEAVFKHRFPDNSNSNRINNVQQDNSFLASIASSTNLNFDGQTFPNFAPSDNNLAVGPNHVIQIINHSNGSAFKIWDKSGTVLQASTTVSSLTGLSGSGDPVVVYDQLADRWLLTEFGKTGNVRYINTLILAISATSNPMGSWKVYSYVVSDNGSAYFVDYPKFAVWANAYYATSNDFNTAGTSYLGSSIYAFDRSAMIAGAPTAAMVRTRLNNASQRYYSMAPVCQEGPATSNQSGLFAFIQDNTWVGGSTNDSIYTFEFTPNFANPASSVVGAFKQLKSNLAFNTNTGNLSQPSPGSTIQALNQRLMNKVIYRNFGSYESIVCNTTDLQGTGTGVHWWELRRSGGAGNWSIYQEGLYHPDNNNRFMGSIAINAAGDIGLLYNVVSSSVYPSARFTARNSCDPLGQMTLSETVVKNGTTYEANNNRYGDYNSLSVDPVNGSFWGTAQYNATGYGTYGNWVTRVVNFSITPCGGGANAGTVSGTSPLCIGQTTTYTSDGDAGGTWSSSNTSVATVDGSGLVTAVAAGTSNITYTVGTASAFQTLTVNPNVTAGVVSGSSFVCIGSSTTLTSSGTAGGSWSSDNEAVATVNASGVVSGVSAGSANITYTVNSGCGSPVSTFKSIDVTACTDPTITCPDNINGSATSACNISITVPDPSTSNVTTLTWTMTGATTASSSGSGLNTVGTANFNVGVTTVTYSASNGGDPVTCSFTVTVADNTQATISCPADISNTQNGVNKCSAVINTPNPNTSGNCSVSSLTWTMTGATTGSGTGNAGTQTFNVGVTTVTYTVTNGAGNTASCSFNVTVRNRKCPNSPAEPLLTTAETPNDKLKVNVFPNPSETYFTMVLESNSTENVEVSVYSINGKLIDKLQGSVFETYRFGNSYSAGTYVVKVKQGLKQSILKLVK
jgi:hypothetical protein